MRVLDQKENEIVSAIMAFSAVREWEFSAALDNKTFELEYFGTQMVKDKSEFPSCINYLAKSKVITIHHNHLSKQSLSWADWRGLTIANCYRRCLANSRPSQLPRHCHPNSPDIVW